jgi:hypothetical protein
MMIRSIHSSGHHHQRKSRCGGPVTRPCQSSPNQHEDVPTEQQKEDFNAVELIQYGGRLPDRRRLLVGGASAASIALGGNLFGVTSGLLSLDGGSFAQHARLDVLFPIKGYKRCVDYQNGFEFIYPKNWLADQRLYRRYAERIERERPLDMPPIRPQRKQRIEKYDPSAGFGPPNGNGEDNISVVAAPIMPGFTIQGLGDPSTAAQSFLDSTIAPPGGDKTAVLRAAGSRTTREGDVVYWFEFTVEKPSRWKRHNVAVIGSRDNALYTFNAQCSESHWESLREEYIAAASSFNMIPTPADRKDFPSSL